MKRVLLALALAGLAATTGRAVLGETLAQLKEHMGKPEAQSRKDAAVWFFEVEAGRLVYTVTFNDKGLSIAEGIKPLKQAVFTSKAAQDFIDAQLTLAKDSKTVRSFQPGETYLFGGQPFTCAPEEYVTVDEARDLVVVWNRSRAPSVIAFRREMLK
ncbi:MAG: hypothetical protein PSW75_12110 [bacterium]|nr:hypothetical protein [bacterium]MDI1337033.1 hypothetical protein [Lacunisphaera sp.]